MSSSKMIGKVAIATDCEPDDWLAIILCAKLGLTIDTFIAGEGNANIKYHCLTHVAKLLAPSAKIICGMDSDRRGFSRKGNEMTLELDGMYIPSLNVLPKQTYNKDMFREFMKEFAKQPNSLLICLKPMRELMEWYMEDPSECSTVCSQIEALFYGSFNFRELIKVHSKEAVNELIHQFKKAGIYESFYATGPQNSINDATDPSIYAAVMSMSTSMSTGPVIDIFLKVIQLWNNCVTYQCKTLASECLIDPKMIDCIFTHLSAISTPTDCIPIVGQYVSDNSFEFVEGKGNEFARYFKVYSSVSEHEASNLSWLINVLSWHICSSQIIVKSAAHHLTVTV